MKVNRKILTAQRIIERQNNEYKKFCDIIGYVTQKLHDAIGSLTAKDTPTQQQYDITCYWLHQSKLLLDKQFSFMRLGMEQAAHIRKISMTLLDTLEKIEKDLKQP